MSRSNIGKYVIDNFKLGNIHTFMINRIIGYRPYNGIYETTIIKCNNYSFVGIEWDLHENYIEKNDMMMYETEDAANRAFNIINILS